MKHQTESTRADRVGQVQITFTNKQLTAWGGACSVVAKFLERIGFREWVLAQVPVQERSPNAKGIYEKVLALLLTSLTGGTRFSHVTWWSHGMEGVARLKTLRLKVLAIPAIYGSGGRRPILRLGVQDRGLRAKIRYWLQRIQRLDLRLFNCNAVTVPATVEA
ncbi:MAG: hypothetical protein ACUVWX_03925 [Kiritimatiellia bacterium]